MKTKLQYFVFRYQDILLNKEINKVTIKTFVLKIITLLVLLLSSIIFIFTGYTTGNLGNIHYLYLSLTTIVFGVFIIYRSSLEQKIKLQYNLEYKTFDAILFDVSILGVFYFYVSTIIIHIYFRSIFSVYLFLLGIISSIFFSIIVFAVHRSKTIAIETLHILSTIIWSSFVIGLLLNIVPLKSITLSIVITLLIFCFLYLIKIKMMKHLKMSSTIKIFYNGIIILVLINFLFPYRTHLLQFLEKDNIDDIYLIDELNTEKAVASNTLFQLSKSSTILQGEDYIYVVSDTLYILDYDYNLITEIDYKSTHDFILFYLSEGTLKACELNPSMYSDESNMNYIQYTLEDNFSFTEELRLQGKHIPIFDYYGNLASVSIIEHLQKSYIGIHQDDYDIQYLFIDDLPKSDIIYQTSEYVIYRENDVLIYDATTYSNNKIVQQNYRDFTVYDLSTYFEDDDSYLFKIYVRKLDHINYLFYYVNHYYISYFEETNYSNYLLVLDNEGNQLHKIQYDGILEVNEDKLIFTDPKVNIKTINAGEQLKIYIADLDDISNEVMPSTTLQSTIDFCIVLGLLLLLNINIYRKNKDQF